jgi:hypothetical protein
MKDSPSGRCATATFRCGCSRSDRFVKRTPIGVSLHLPQQWLDVIDRCVPAFLRGLARDNAGVRGSGTYLQIGGISYRMYCFAKA